MLWAKRIGKRCFVCVGLKLNQILLPNRIIGPKEYIQQHRHHHHQHHRRQHQVQQQKEQQQKQWMNTDLVNNNNNNNKESKQETRNEKIGVGQWEG